MAEVQPPQNDIKPRSGSIATKLPEPQAVGACAGVELSGVSLENLHFGARGDCSSSSFVRFCSCRALRLAGALPRHASYKA